MNKYIYLEEDAKKMIDDCKLNGFGIKDSTSILMTIGGFISDLEALHLRDLLWYASDNGMNVNFISIN